MPLGTSPDTLPLAMCDPGKNLDDACHDVEAKISRTDSEAPLLLAIDGAILAGLAGVVDKELPLPAQFVGGAAVLALVAAAVLLLLDMHVRRVPVLSHPVQRGPDGLAAHPPHPLRPVAAVGSPAVQDPPHPLRPDALPGPRPPRPAPPGRARTGQAAWPRAPPQPLDSALTGEGSPGWRLERLDGR